jgi:DNA modification methylase
MTRLTETEKKKLIDLVEKGKPLPSVYKGKHFAREDGTFIQATKEYRLVYKGKARREDIIAGTPEAPFQLVRQFNENNKFPDGWRNMLISGDNLLALKELYADQRGPNRYRTRDRIKLIYIDPPFATKQDFLKDKEKAYRDKVIGAQFIEFLRKRLILLREILANDGTIYVHLDTKKGHYIKTILDEVFGEENFQNELIWKRTPFAGSSKARAVKFPINHDTIFFYSKSDGYEFTHQYEDYSPAYKKRFKHKDDNGWYRKTSLKTYSAETEAELRAEGRFLPPQKKGAYPSYKQYLHESKGKQIEDIWNDINIDNPMSESRAEFEYPRMKPELLLSRIIKASSQPGDIVLDAFVGSGTTIAVAEKLERRWIGMDCGKLAIYTAQKRLMSLSVNVGLPKKDDSLEYERTVDFGDHLRACPSLLLVTEKARRGECDITLDLLEDLAQLIKKHGLAKRDRPFALICPEEKLKIPASRLDEPEDDGEPGEKIIKINGVEFRVSFIVPRHKTEKDKSLKAKEFALFNAGIYDNEAVKQMIWEEYRPFVLKLFQVREHEHFIKGFRCDGYVGVHSAFVWNYPGHKKLTIDYDYVKSIHETMSGSGGEKFFIIVPIVSMGFAEDEYPVGKTTYVFLKVPISILMRLLQSGEIGALKQPTKEADVNEVIDAVGFDFISQPEAQWKCKKEHSPDAPLLKDYVIHLTEFRSKTLATDPEDFANFETFSMAMVDTDYDGHIFKLSKVFWAHDLVAAELKRLKNDKKAKQWTSRSASGCRCAFPTRSSRASR